MIHINEVGFDRKHWSVVEQVRFYLEKIQLYRSEGEAICVSYTIWGQALSSNYNTWWWLENEMFEWTTEKICQSLYQDLF